MYQTDDQCLSWRHAERPGPDSDTAASSSDPTSFNDVGSKGAGAGDQGPASFNDADSFRALATGDITIGSAKAKAFDVCRHSVQHEDLISEIFNSE